MRGKPGGIGLALFGVAVIGCAGHTPPPAPPPPKPPPPSFTPITLRERWDATIELRRSDSVIVNLPNGGTQLQQFSRVGWFSLTVGPQSVVRVRLDSLQLFNEGQPMPAGDVTGATWLGQMLGTRVNWVSAPPSEMLFQDMGNDVRSFFPRLPAGGVIPGLRWTDTTSRKATVDVFTGDEEGITQWSSDSMTTHGGVEAMPISAQEEFEQAGKGHQNGMEMSMTAQGRRMVWYYLSRDGRVDDLQMRDSVAVLISIPSSGQLVPSTKYVRTSVAFTTSRGTGQ